jgi:tetratricopeptide (TPR) repeat protein
MSIPSDDTQNSVYQMINKIREHIRSTLYSGNFDYVSSINALNRHLKLAIEVKHWLLAGQIEEMIGTIGLERGEFAEAERHYQHSLQYFEMLEDTRRITVMLGNLGEVYRRWNKAEIAADCFQRARNISEREGFKPQEAISYNNEGLLWLAENATERAIPLLEKALSLSDGLAWDTLQVLLPETYAGLATAYLHIEDFEQAWMYANRALQLSLEVARVQHIAAAYQIMAQIAIADLDSESSPAELFAQSRDYWQRAQDKVSLANMLMIEGEYWNALQDLDKALGCFDEAARYYDEVMMIKKADAARKTIDSLRYDVN